MFDNNSYTVAQKTLKATPKMANYIKDVYDSGRSSPKRNFKMSERKNNMTDSPFADRIDKQIEDQIDKKIIMAANSSPNSQRANSIRQKVE